MTDPVADGRCPHCGSRAPTDAPSAPYCCKGCQLARAFLVERGLSRYDDLLRESGVPVGEPREGVLPFVEETRTRASLDASGARRVRFALSGVHCAACVWIIEELFRRRAGGRHIALNPVRGTVLLTIDDSFDLSAFALDVGQAGYPLGPASDTAPASSDDLLLRMGVAIALALNVMVLSLASYLGLDDDGGLVARVFLLVSGLLSTAALLVGGPVFARGTWLGLRAGRAPLDLPIATGMFLAWAGSVVSAVVGDGRSAYFDTVTIFIALMLVGRFVQASAVDRNRRLLAVDAPDDGLRATRIDDDGRPRAVRAVEIRTGDRLLIAPGELVPTDGVLEDDAAALSFAFITGEPGSAEVPRGSGVMAGAKNDGDRAIRVRATAPYASSILVRLLADVDEPDEHARTSAFVSVYAKSYVALVSVLALGGFAWWWHVAGAGDALDVAVAVLVVTCPCAIGLAAPLSVELALARLRGLGVYVRRASVLDRLLEVRALVFDKTGTLSLLAPSLRDPKALDALDDDERRVLSDMASRSRHPKSRAIAEALGAAPLDPDATVVEEPGVGLTLTRSDGAHFRLIRHGDQGEVAFTRDGETRALLSFVERARPGARAEIARLRASGLDVRVLSGDDATRARAFADTLGIDEERVRGGLSPDDKARAIEALADSRPLYVGDGLNDTLALERAYVAATPAALHPAVPARADLFTLSDGVVPIADILSIARAARATQRRNLTGSTLYNVAVLTLALTGHMSPLLAAVLMPLSSVVVVAHTALALRARAPAERTPWATAGLRPLTEPR